MATAITFGVDNTNRVLDSGEWYDSPDPKREACNPYNGTYSGEGDWTLHVIYYLDDLAAGASKTVKIVYRRM